MKENRVKYITVDALLIALVCVSTIAIQIPIPLGYMHLGNMCILLAGAMFGPVSGLLAGGIGSALADLLTGYTQWVLPTLIIKGIMGWTIGAIACRGGRIMHIRSARTFIAGVAGIAIMIFGYFIGGSILYGSIYTGATQIPGLTLEGVLGILLFYAVGFALEKAKVPTLLRERLLS
ncbi:MAG: ECF transporter S component [Clostridiales bacterium]|nr:ECF transporter S component [Clostridiales bacterium]